MLIDFHMHIFSDSLAPRAVQNLLDTAQRAQYPLQKYTDATRQDTLLKMAQWQVDAGVFLNIATKPGQQKNINDFCVAMRSDRMIPFGSVHPDAPDWREELVRIQALGLRGIKLHPDYQNFDIDEPRLVPLFETARDLGLLVVLHAGFDPYSPKHVHCTPKGCRTVLEKVPGIRMILAHMGGMYLWDEVEAFLVGEDVFFDTSFVAGAIAPAQMKRIIETHGADKILFGSDCPWSSSEKQREFIQSLGLAPEQQAKIFYENACALLGMQRKEKEDGNF